MQRLAYTTIVIAAAVGSPGLLALLFALPCGATAEFSQAHEGGDDGWRLTKQGWDQLSPRVLPAAGARETWPNDAVPAGWDLHPATLTILLVLVVISAFFLFPHRAGLHSRHKSESLF